jgi:hypothetical protein
MKKQFQTRNGFLFSKLQFIEMDAERRGLLLPPLGVALTNQLILGCSW